MEQYQSESIGESTVKGVKGVLEILRKGLFRKLKETNSEKVGDADFEK